MIFFFKFHLFRKINAFFLITRSCQPWKTNMTSCMLCMRRPKRRFETSVVNRSLELCDTITCPPPCSVSHQTRWPRNSRAHYGVNVIIHQDTHQQRGSKFPSPSNRIRGSNQRIRGSKIPSPSNRIRGSNQRIRGSKIPSPSNRIKGSNQRIRGSKIPSPSNRIRGVN